MNKHAQLQGDEQAPAADAAGGDTAYRYWAFLSYSHADSNAADRLHKRLEKFRVPDSLVGKPHPLGTIPKYVKPIFRDRQELAAASSLSREIDEALVASRYLIVLCSPSAATSRWVNDEVRRFKQLHGEDRVLAAIIEGEPFSDEAECFPPALRYRVGKDGQLTKQKVEPIAADLRDDRDGPHIGALKIAAGMLEVGLDDLIQRDQRRRNKRARWIVAGSLAGMAFTTGLSVVALNARDTAREERREAESLLSFMLGDLRTELEPIGELDSLDKVAQRVLDYYERHNKRDLTDEQLSQRSKALALLAEIALMRGNLNEAAGYYQASLKGSAELIRRYPDDPQRLFDHAQSVFWVGDLATRRGRLDEAMAAFQSYGALADRMVAIEPTKRDWQMEVQYAAVNVGFVQQKKRDFPAATASFKRALASIEKVAAAEPDNQDYQKNLAEALAWLAEAEQADGHLSDALSLRRRQVELLEQAANRYQDIDFRDRLMAAQSTFGLLLSLHGDTATGLAQMREAVAAGQKLISTEPGNMRWKQRTGLAQIRLARALLTNGRVSEAAIEGEAACGLAEQLSEKDQGDTTWRELVTDCFLTRSRIAARQGSEDKARALANRAIATANKQMKQDRDSATLLKIEALFLRGSAKAREGDRKGAIADWNAALLSWPANLPEKPDETALRAELLQALGKNRDARQLRRQLAESGYLAGVIAQ